MNLDVNSWKEFEIGKIFEKKKVKKYSKIPENRGKFPFISSTSINNGITTYCDLEPIEGNCITISTNGDCFDAFYQPNPIVISSDVEVLYSEKLNVVNAMFFCTLFRCEKFRWSYGRKPKDDKVFKTIIRLPICLEKDNKTPIIDKTYKYSAEGYIPDFDYMENYIKSLHYNSLRNDNMGVEIFFKWK